MRVEIEGASPLAFPRPPSIRFSLSPLSSPTSLSPLLPLSLSLSTLSPLPLFLSSLSFSSHLSLLFSLPPFPISSFISLASPFHSVRSYMFIMYHLHYGFECWRDGAVLCVLDALLSEWAWLVWPWLSGWLLWAWSVWWSVTQGTPCYRNSSDNIAVLDSSGGNGLRIFELYLNIPKISIMFTL